VSVIWSHGARSHPPTDLYYWSTPPPFTGHRARCSALFDSIIIERRSAFRTNSPPIILLMSDLPVQRRRGIAAISPITFSPINNSSESSFIEQQQPAVSFQPTAISDQRSSVTHHYSPLLFTIPHPSLVTHRHSPFSAELSAPDFGLRTLDSPPITAFPLLFSPLSQYTK